jgi:hypothetical protein
MQIQTMSAHVFFFQDFFQEIQKKMVFNIDEKLKELLIWSLILILF